MPVAAFAVVVALAGLMAAVAPVEVAMASVLAFAGPHNLLEFRYLIGRLPSRLVVFKRYFVVAAIGLLVLAAGSIALSWLGRRGGTVPGELAQLAAIWHSGLIAWVALLVVLKRRERPGRSIEFVLPIALVAASAAWWQPGLFGLGLVYAHPLLSLWFLDRELRGRHRRWRPAFHRALLVIPAVVALIWWVVPTPAVAETAVRDLITRQAGASLLAADPGQRLIATHAFLELLHYGVWIGLLPALAIRGRLWDPAAIPTARTGPRVRMAVTGLLMAAATVTVALWIGFSFDYVATRDLYFTVAIVHVLAEVPALIRLS